MTDDSTDTYTGDVLPGGPSDVRELDGLTIRKASVGEFDNNCYLLTCTRTGDQLLIDAAADPARLRRLIDEGTGSLGKIVTTHRHPDHVRALPDLAASTGAATLAGEDDADALPLAPGTRLRHGDEVSLGDLLLTVTHLRGHTPGSVALSWVEPGGRAHLFTGDSLFPGGVGNTQADQTRFAQLIDDVEQRVFALFGDDTWVYPGHGADTTLGRERPNLAAWLERGW